LPQGSKIAGCQLALQVGIKKGRFDPVFLCISSAMVVVMLSERWAAWERCGYDVVSVLTAMVLQ
jgi:hypothetical protein